MNIHNIMKVAHLHIGSYKTGTTSIQNIFHRNRGALLQHGFNYPGDHANHHFTFLATGANQKDQPRQLNSYGEKTINQIRDKYFSSLESDFEAGPAEYIISTEYLFITEKGYIENYLNYLQQFFDEIKVYVFLRDPVDYFRSAQQQMIKARSYIDTPQEWELTFREVIEAWEEFVEIEVIEYKKGIDSCKTLCERIGVNYDHLTKPSRESNASLSVEQILLLAKVQRHLYRKHEDQFKNHLGVIQKVNTSFTHKPQLQDWVRPVIYQNHLDDLEWLNENYGINFLQDYPTVDELSDFPTFENGKATVRDVYKVPSEETVERYEALVVDALLKKLVQGIRN